MRVAAIRIELHVPDSLSLKQKRSVVRSVTDRLRKKLSVSVAEVDHHDTWQRVALGVAIVAPDARHLDRLIERVRAEVSERPDADLLGFTVTHMEEAGE